MTTNAAILSSLNLSPDLALTMPDHQAIPTNSMPPGDSLSNLQAIPSVISSRHILLTTAGIVMLPEAGQAPIPTASPAATPATTPVVVVGEGAEAISGSGPIMPAANTPRVAPGAGLNWITTAGIPMG
ncbi:hypothetical protein FPQ18DRAFT_310113 [Pyronema domesticum]|nr:hypothetical protein FPQ18DRAFT_310113 [Pyronema domesticum]